MPHLSRVCLPFVCFLLLGQTRPATAPASRAAAQLVNYYSLSPEQFFKLPQTQARIKKDAADIPLLEAAVFQATNRERIANKLPLFRYSFAMQLSARLHSREMVDLQYFDHESPTPANRTLAERFRNIGLVNVTGGENIAILPALEMGSGTYIIHENGDGSETLTDQASGQRINYNTYEELAKAVLVQWMNSPPHRENILAKRYLFLGVGAVRGPYPKKPQQDSFYFTQNFSASITAASETKASTQLSAPATRPK